MADISLDVGARQKVSIFSES